MPTLYKRKILDQINKFLDSQEIVVLHGARQVGKTSIMSYLMNELKKKTSAQIFYFDLEIPRYLELAEKGFEVFQDYLSAKGYQEDKKTYVFIDEIQYLTNPSNFLKLFHDNLSSKIKLIVSGSSSFEIKSKFKNSLVGRTVNFEIWPLAFDEFLLFKNKKYDLLVNNLPSAINQELINLYKEYALYGGYPQIVLEDNIEKKEIYLNQIINTYIKKDIRDLANIRNIDKFNKLIQVLSAQSGNLLNALELSNTVGLSRETIEDYLFLLENTYIIKQITPFYKNLRSELFKTPKIYLIDHGIANLLTFKTFPKVISGNIFETAIFSDLLKSNKTLAINFWRTATKQEVDFIIDKGGKITAFEAKLNINNAGLAGLRHFIKEYNCSTGYIVFLDGEINKNQKNQNGIIEYIYPWQMQNILI